jgi:hypothetical protein
VKQENPAFKQSIEFYIDRSMGLCVETTKEDGSQVTAQYRTSDEARQWLDDWLRSATGISGARAS